MKNVLFYQHFGLRNVVRGAHHKTFDFFHHIKSFSNYKPEIFFAEDSIWEPNIPWYSLFDSMPTLKKNFDHPDILFLNSGKDWIKYSAKRDIPEHIPIVSPVNNFRAVNPNHKSFKFLTRKAIRLCPSQELYEAVKNHPNTNGPTIYLPNGVGIKSTARKLLQSKNIDILLVGNKNPIMAHEILNRLNYPNAKIEIIDRWISKTDFQNLLARSKISVHLPKIVEEHYIPGVEAMMLNSLVIIPDCVGNRSYSKHEDTCYVADYNTDAMTTSIDYVFNMSKEDKLKLITNAKEHSFMFEIEHEAKELEKVLNMTEQIWP